LNPGTNIVRVIASDRAVPANSIVVTQRVVYLPLSPLAAKAQLEGLVSAIDTSAESADSVLLGNAPTLHIDYSVGKVVIDWEPALAGDRLQTATTLWPPDWTDAPGARSGPMTIPLENGTRFFRVIRR
jgi:hypothetical protein